jgi:hypothetical protein
MARPDAAFLGRLPFQNVTSEKGRGGNDPLAKLMGNDLAELTARNGEGVISMAANSRKLDGAKYSPSTKFSPDFSSDKELKADFSALILQFPDKVLAYSADCSPETVKCWKAERTFPHGRHLMKLVADFPKIRAWHSRRTGGLDHPQSQSELYAALEKVMASGTAEGRAMRARFQQILAEQS